MSKRTNPQSQQLAIIYTRISTKGQEENTSLDTQEAACCAYAEANGYTIGRITREVYTGAELWDRPKLAQDRADIKAGQYQALIVYSLDRLSRSPVHLAIIVEEMERAGAALQIVSEPLDSSPEGQLVAYIKGYAAAIERERIRERQLRGKRARALAGKVHNAGAELYGYRRDKEAGVRVVYEPEAAIVRRIFNWYVVDGLSNRAIVARLNDQGVPPPSAGKFDYGDPNRVPRWGHSSTLRILTHPAYRGDAVAWRYESRGNNKYPGIRPDEEWLKLPEGTCPALIDPAVYDAAQERLRDNKGQHTRNMDAARQYLFRGLITCSVCGCSMQSSPERGRRTYRCSSREKVQGACGGKRVNAEVIEAWVWDHIKAILNDPNIIAAEVERLREQGPDTVLADDRAAIERSLAKNARKREQWIARMSDAEDDDGSLWTLVRGEIAKLDRERVGLQSALADIEARLAHDQHTMVQLDALHAYADRVRENLDAFGFEEKRLAVEALGIHISANGRDWTMHGDIPGTDIGFDPESGSESLQALRPQHAHVGRSWLRQDTDGAGNALDPAADAR